MIKKIKSKMEAFLLALILLLSAVLNFANIGIEGFANTFYAAGVKSMMMNLKNFFFASFDPSGFVTIDKPPLGLMIQTISSKIFGFSGWSVILPQAVAGVISVWLIYYLVKRSFGSLAGLIAALCLAVTPIFVAASRNNTIDNLLVLCLLLACWALFIAAEKGKFKFLILSLFIVGIGFNIKMVEAYMLAPAIYITYLLSSALPFKKKIKHLLLGTIVLFVVSLSWAVVADLVPTGDRPFIGSSTNNTVMELIIGHNGLQRIGVGGKNNARGKGQQEMSKNQSANSSMRTRTGGASTTGAQPQKYGSNVGRTGQGGMGATSKSGILRLFSKNSMSDQISWLLPLALIGFIVAAIEEKFKFPFDNKRKLSLLLWFTWLLPEFIYFSFSSNITHTYYLTTMAPSIAALVGIGLTSMYRSFNKDGFKKWILPGAFIINGLVETLILSYNYSTSNGYKIVTITTAILSIGFSIILALVNIYRGRNINKNATLNKILISISFIGILVAPMVWSFTPIFHKMNGSSPSAGLELFSSKQQVKSTVTDNSKLIKFLEANRKDEKYLVEVPSAMTYGSDLILKTGEPILTLGGFSGSDPILTINQFKQLVASGSLRYAMVSGSANRGMGMVGDTASNSNSAIMSWIKANGKVVLDSKWKDTTKIAVNNNKSSGLSNYKSGGFGGDNSEKLYDLKAYTDSILKK
ncbi:glycosyltransferase family 39 protein [Clostridium estertheticum]|uniref:glycosyltransferase family 39 protein n=1 Tax=Clostridium estertheticum TaxID=238834 RepID=UPI001C6EAEF2|nr:glycosyltransferase family 39 protein [Clostridium estertheticum]MBW9171579.1 glycosyltransferase family 39 protein [Clostridium estertheticum]WLC77075.1 glycosyltransferase family 39 protein [Clostridium estertheticum]